MIDRQITSEKRAPLVAASLLAGHFLRLGDELISLEEAGIDWIHVDVMDGHFVDNIAFGPEVVASLRSVTNRHIDVHAMVAFPQRFYERFIEAGASSVTVHFEARHDCGRTLTQIKRHNCLAGLAINPDTPVASVIPVLPLIDILLIMSVHPGHAGQTFLTDSIAKVKAATDYRDEYHLDFRIEVDGGINSSNAGRLRRAGADVLVSGSYLFKASSRPDAVACLRTPNSPLLPSA